MGATNAACCRGADDQKLEAIGAVAIGVASDTEFAKTPIAETEAGEAQEEVPKEAPVETEAPQEVEAPKEAEAPTEAEAPAQPLAEVGQTMPAAEAEVAPASAGEEPKDSADATAVGDAKDAPDATEAKAKAMKDAKAADQETKVEEKSDAAKKTSGSPKKKPPSDGPKKKPEEARQKKKEDAAKKKKDEAKKKKQEEEAALKKANEAAAAEKTANEEAPKTDGADSLTSKEAIKARDAAWKKLPEPEKKEKALPLLNAAKAGSIFEATELIKSGVSANAADGDGWTGLMKAAEAGKCDMLDFLFDHGADSSAAVKLGEWGNNALHHAARQGNADAVKLLLARGKKGDITAKNFQGKIPKDYATDSETKSLLRKAAK